MKEVMRIDKPKDLSGTAITGPQAITCEAIKFGKCFDEHGTCVSNCSDPLAPRRGKASE